MGDILHLNYIPHSHQENQQVSDSEHDHSLLTIFDDDSENQNESLPAEQIEKDKIEYSTPSVESDDNITSLLSKEFSFLEPTTLSYKNKYLPPPEVI